MLIYFKRHRRLMRTYDISLTITPDLPTWPGDPKLVLERFSKMEEGASCNVTQISACVHIGTHVDAPYHYLGGQAKTIDQIPLNILTGRTYVLQLPDEVDLITPEVLIPLGVPPRTRRLLFKTRNSACWSGENNHFHEDFVAISRKGRVYRQSRDPPGGGGLFIRGAIRPTWANT